MVFWDLIFDLLLTTFSHFAGTDFSLVFNVLVYHVLNEKKNPRGPEASPPRPIFFLDVSKLRKVKHTIPLERYHEKHASRRRFGRFLLCSYDNDSQSRFLEIPFPSFTIFGRFRLPISSQNLTKSWKSGYVFLGLEKLRFARRWLTNPGGSMRRYLGEGGNWETWAANAVPR